MKYQLTHTTVYEYDAPVLTGRNLVHLSVRDLPHQQCHHSELHVEPTPHAFASHSDYFGNRATSFEIDQPHDRLTIRASSEVAVDFHGAPDLSGGPAWEQAPSTLAAAADAATLEAYQFAFDSPYVRMTQALAEYARGSFQPGRPLPDAAMDLTRRIHSDFQYTPGATTLATGIEEVMQRRQGVCQDFAHLQIGCLRALGLAARYVSGYVRTVTGPGQQTVGGAASHAWVGVFCPGRGWIDFDPTNNCVVQADHITLAWGRDYGDVSPIKGVVLGGGAHRLHVDVQVAER